MAKFCQEMHFALPMSVIYVSFFPLQSLLLLHQKSDFGTDDAITIMMLEINLLSYKWGCLIAVGS
jgi:hypothetical protein